MTEPTITMLVTEEEQKTILDRRVQLAEAPARIANQATCKHVWSYLGGYRGESGYECKCGATKWE